MNYNTCLYIYVQIMYMNYLNLLLEDNFKCLEDDTHTVIIYIN